jgi:hypothetical protein
VRRFRRIFGGVNSLSKLVSNWQPVRSNTASPSRCRFTTTSYGLPTVAADDVLSALEHPGFAAVEGRKRHVHLPSSIGYEIS